MQDNNKCETISIDELTEVTGGQVVINNNIIVGGSGQVTLPGSGSVSGGPQRPAIPNNDRWT